jgi:tetratricopeptide (TPR) repeat protein
MPYLPMSNSFVARIPRALRSLPLESRLALALVVCSALGGFGWLWWSAVKRSEVNFLPSLAGAEWIIYPKAAEGKIHPRLRLGTVFRRTFVLNEVPDQSSLGVAGFHEYSIVLNGEVLTKLEHRGTSWKEPDLFSPSKFLHRGTNEILVTASNTNGPPALWLSLTSRDFSLSSDDSWEASYAGALWKPVHRAKNPLPIRVGNPLHAKNGTAEAFANCWPTLLMFTAISALVIFVSERIKSAESGASGFWFQARFPIVTFAILWIAIFINNICVLPAASGYDAGPHRDYIAYVETKWSVPLASEGWEMFQPPFYYVICAVLLKLLHLTAYDSAGVAVLRVFGLVIGVLHFVIVWKSLRLLFPENRTRQNWGLLLAAALPPVLYLSHYVSNEALAAALVSGSVYLSLRILREQRSCWRVFAGLGLCSGAALLTKSTAILALPPIFGALVWSAFRKKAINVRESGIRRINIRQSGILRILLVAAICLCVAGWHYLRVWQHYGSPMVGVWDPRTGFSWWQDNGFRTTAFYLRLGDVFIHPWFSALHSFSDGTYSTLWGDGLLGGADSLEGPPWNYELMSVAYWLALVPMLAVLIGVFFAIRCFVRQPSPEWFLLLGLSFSVAFALAYVSLTIPYYCVVKAFYGLSALVPFCAFGAWGLERMTRLSDRDGVKATFRGRLIYRNPPAAICSLLLGLWALSSYASFWIVHSSAATVLARAAALKRENRPFEAQRLLEKSLASNPKDPRLRAELAKVLGQMNNQERALKEASIVARSEPENPVNLATLVSLAADTHPDQAIEYAERAIKIAPGYALAYQQLGAIYLSQGNFAKAEQVTREGLAFEPFNSTFHQTLGESLVRQGKVADGIAALKLSCQIRPENVWAHSILAEAYELQHQTANAISEYKETLRLNPNLPDALNSLAWLRATDPHEEFRDRSESVQLAERACQLTGYKEPKFVSTLAATYAEAGRFEEAAQTAIKARDLASAAGQQQLVEKNEELIKLFSARQPYRQPQK